MSAPVSNGKFLLEKGMVTFSVNKNVNTLFYEEAKGYVKGLLATMKKTALIFSDIVVSRSTVHQRIDGDITLSHLHIYKYGRFSSEEFLKLITFKPGITNEELEKYISSINGKISVVKS